jgi:peptidoglycan lytic transglycosylase D
MLKNNPLYSICSICLLLLVFTACATGGASSQPITQTPEIITPGPLNRAEVNVKRGEELLAKGDLDAAKYHFDRAIDILMDASNRQQLNLYITRISELELNVLEDRSAQNEDAHESFIDGTIATPLFQLSPQEIRAMQEKLHHEKTRYTIPITINSWVASFIKAFRTTRKKNIQNALNRSQEYIEEFKRIFKSHGVPEDLAYLPIIESGFRVHALSRARARGVWQFMAYTARHYGLRVDWVVDERREPFKAAHAAAKFLKELHGKYDDWYLALACYNAGTRRINRGIRHLKTKDFFKIAKSRYLRRETRNYVPAFLASLIIARNPEAYGFTLEPIEKRFTNTKTIQIPSPASLKNVASVANVPYHQLQKINPELIREFTPFNKKEYTIRVPKTVDAGLLAQLKRLPPAKRYFVGWYRVKRGDSLYSIARKFNTSVGKIKRANKLRSNLIRPGKRLLIPRGI